MSANYGNMTTVAAASLFMQFIPLLPSQILLNNLISDIPCLTISTDNVDEEWLKKPKRWNLNFIHTFMIYFGLLSTIFDLILISSLIFLFKAEPKLFRTVWFVESALSEIIITFVVRTKRPFFKSKASMLLIITSIFAAIITLVITYLRAGSLFFEFVKIPLSIILLVSLILVSYFLSAEVAKKYFFGKFEI